VSEVDMQLATIQATVSQAGAGASSDLINSMIAPMKARAEATKNYLLGKSTALAYQQDLANEQARDALNFLHGADPETRRILTVSKLVPGISSSLGQAADAVMIKSLGINGGDPKETPNPVNPVIGKDSQSYQSTKGYFDSINTAVSKDNSGTLPADAKQELANNINNIMRGVLINGEQAKTPSDFNGVVTFLARPDVNTWAVKNKGMINSESASGANKVLMQQYTLTVEPLVKKEFIDAGLPNGKLDLPASPVQMGMGLGVNIGLEPAGPRLKAVFSGGGVVFMPVDPKDTNATSKAKELNKNVSPVVNNLVRATATMEGTDNFRKVYQNEFAPWFDSSPELPPIPIGETTNPKQ
jgi:hypothetical protein